MKLIPKKLLCVTLSAAALLSTQLRADDIDLYTGGASATGSNPNVLIVLDNSTNWAAANQGWPSGKQGEAELEAMAEVIGTLGDSVNVGLLMAAGSNGGYVRFAVRAMDSTNKTAFQNMLNTMKANFGNDGDNDDKVNSASIVYDSMMNAAFRYFNGFARFGTTDLPSGSQADLRDFQGSTVNTSKMPAGSLSGNSLLGSTAAIAQAATTYNKPGSAADGCAKNYIIFIGNGYPNQSGATTDLSDAATLAGITSSSTITSITTAVPGGSARLADEWARFMYTYGVKSTVDDPKSTTTPKAKLVNRIATFTIDVCKDACDSDQATLLKSMANVGGGHYYKSTSKSEIKNALARIFSEIQAVNSVFASATLPISVNTQGTFENQVYIGVFRPDGGARPRWLGNLKEYKFGRYCDADRNGKAKIDTTRALVNGMIPATLTGNATGTVTGSFTGNITNQAGTTSSVTGTVSGSISGTASATLAATFGTSAGTTDSPMADRGSGNVTGSVTDSSGRTSTFTGVLNGTASVSGGTTSTDERIGDDVPAPDCGSDATGKIPLSLYMGDKNGYRAIDEDGNTGFIDLSAKSYWTAASTFWSFRPEDPAGSSDLPDGPSVERGAAAFRLRNVWGATPATNQTDGRNIYTCLSACLNATRTDTTQDTTNLTLSTHHFTVNNSAVTTALAAPSTSAISVTLARSGNTVTATAASHSFNTGDAVAISGANQSEYNSPTGGSFTVTKLSSTQFTYTVTETPATSGSGTVALASNTTTVSSIVLSSATAGDCTSGACKPGKTVTATMSTSAIPSDPVNVTGTNKSYLDVAGMALASGSGTSTVTFTTTTPTAPAGATDLKAGVSSGTWIETGLTGAFDATNNRFTVTKTAGGNYPNSLKNLTAGASVIISSATESKYNGTWQLASNAGNTVMTFTYVTYSGCSPCTGATASTPGASDTFTLVRTTGSTTVTGSRTTNNLVGGSALSAGMTVTISGITGYNGNHVLDAVDNGAAKSFTFSDNVTLSPATPATGTISAIAAGSTGGPTTTNLINWTRGKDLWEDENLNSSLTDVRASIHGDVLHGRPAVVNYGGSIGIYAFYGSNDGFLRGVHGGLSSVDGEEKWAFIPEEFVTYSKLSRLYTDSPLIRFPNSLCSVSPSPTARTYFWDGVTAAYQSTNTVYYTTNPASTSTTEPTSGCYAAGTCYKRPEKSWIFAGMRRGGRSIYAIDVSVPNTPKFMWRVTNTMTGFSELAQTWSEPKISKLKGTFTRSGGWVPITDPLVVIFGAGYDDAQEDKPVGTQVTPTKGRGVFVVDAESGQLIQFLQPTSGVTGYSFTADVNVLDMNNDGYADRIYAADTNANLFRFDTVQTVTNVADSAYWKRYHIAKLGDVDNNGGANARKFMFQPEVLPFTYSGTSKALVLLGSGNREKPLPNFETTGHSRRLTCQSSPGPFYGDTYYPPYSSADDDNDYKVNDRFFGLIDAVQSGATESTVNGDPIRLNDLTWVNQDPAALTAFSLSGTARGWQILLRNDPDGDTASNLTEEKTVNAARVVAGTVFFGTNSPVLPNPSAGICSNLGEALGYAVDPFTGLPAFNRDGSVNGSGQATLTATDYATKFVGGGLPPTVTSGVVTIGGTPYRFAIGTGSATLTSASSIGGGRVTLNLTGTRTKLYWSYGAD
ncbi:MAG: hypothetical protein HZB40_03045 [Rhodocyclales bacterium]|nr:hypothetical protein [Rhodocyclales bacterium]